MRSLLDVNVLLALLEPAHIFHDAASDWFDHASGEGWASCPITQNGFLRIVSQPKYHHQIPLVDAVDAFGELVRATNHVFWPDDISFLDSPQFDRTRLLASGQITDSYLLALAVHNGGQLATFDKRLVASAVPSGMAHLCVIG